MSLKKLCSKCGTIINYGKTRCDKCEVKYNNDKKKYYSYYDKNVRDKHSQDFYNSPEWLEIKKAVHVRDNGMCIICWNEKKIKYVETVHHIEPLKENYDKRLSISNLISLCKRHHAQVHSIYDSNKLNKSNLQKKLFEMIKISKNEF